MGTKSTPPAKTIPERLWVFFHEYDPDQLDLKRDANLVIQRVLEFGDWEEIRWLFTLYGSRRIRKFIHLYGERWLKPVSFNHWRQLLRIRRWRPSPFPVSREDVWVR